MKNPVTPPANPPVQKLLLDVADVCHGANLSRQMLYKLWARGEGPRRIKLGARTLVRVTDLASWVQSLPAEEVSA